MDPIDGMIQTANETGRGFRQTIRKSEDGHIIFLHGNQRGYLVLDLWAPLPVSFFGLAGWDGEKWRRLDGATNEKCQDWLTEASEFFSEEQ